MGFFFAQNIRTTTAICHHSSEDSFWRIVCHFWCLDITSDNDQNAIDLQNRGFGPLEEVGRRRTPNGTGGGKKEVKEG